MSSYIKLNKEEVAFKLFTTLMKDIEDKNTNDNLQGMRQDLPIKISQQYKIDLFRVCLDTVSGKDMTVPDYPEC